MPATGPVRAIECLPEPNQVLPNGMRNPWAPYAGETYRPAADAAVNQQMGRSAGIGSVVGGGRSLYGPIGGGGSVIAPRSVAGSVATGYSGGSIGLGGYRADDGWDGAVGRAHQGVAPDMSSTAGAIPRVNTQSSWLHAASSPLNHARMSPVMPPPLAHSGIYLQPPVAHSSHRPRRAASVRSVPIDDECRAKCCGSSHGRPRSSSGGSVHSDRRSIREGGVPIPGGGGGQQHYRKLGGGNSLMVGSPLRQSSELPLGRKVSMSRSHRSTGSARRCSECSA